MEKSLGDVMSRTAERRRLDGEVGLSGAQRRGEVGGDQTGPSSPSLRLVIALQTAASSLLLLFNPPDGGCHDHGELDAQPGPRIARRPPPCKWSPSCIATVLRDGHGPPEERVTLREKESHT